jgi:hypothetical protein
MRELKIERKGMTKVEYFGILNEMLFKFAEVLLYR